MYEKYSPYQFQQQGGNQGLGSQILPWVGVGAQLFDTFSNYLTSRNNTRRTIRANIEQSEKAFAHEKEMWHMMNEYNTPTAQMERFKQAGLNPNLIYGQGTPGNVGSYPTYQPPQIQYQDQPLQIAPALREYQSVRQENPQIEQSKIKAWVDKELAGARTEQEKVNLAFSKISQRIEEIKQTQFWEEGINPNDSAFIRYGIWGLKTIGENYQEWIDKLLQMMPDIMIKQIFQGNTDIDALPPDTIENLD